MPKTKKQAALFEEGARKLIENARGIPFAFIPQMASYHLPIFADTPYRIEVSLSDSPFYVVYSRFGPPFDEVEKILNVGMSGKYNFIEDACDAEEALSRFENWLENIRDAAQRLALTRCASKQLWL